MASERRISDGSRPIVGDLDRIRGYQLTSNGSHVIRLRKESWVPWISYLRQWNAANAYNLALISEAAYLQQKTAFQKKAADAGVPKISDVIEDKEKQVALLFSRLRHKESADIRKGHLPILTRTVAREDGFQDLRFWDAAQFRDQSGKEELDAEALTGFYDLDTQAFAASSPEQVLIAVRGTEPKADDWLLDFDFSIVADFVAGPDPYETAHGEAFRVHRGFLTGFLFLQRYVKAYLDAYLEKRDENGNRTGEMKDVILTGHSLGGATALLLAAYIRSQHAQNVMLYSYGMPRVAERAFADHYGVNGTEPIVHWRHVHHQDIVTRIPATWSRYNPLYATRRGKGPTQSLVETATTWDAPYAHHGEMVYLPNVKDEDARPIHGAEDGSPLKGMPEHRIVNIEEILLPYVVRKLIWTAGTEAENAENDVRTRTPMETESWEALTTDPDPAPTETGSRSRRSRTNDAPTADAVPEWVRSLQGRPLRTSLRPPGQNAASHADGPPTSWKTTGSQEVARAASLVPLIRRAERNTDVSERWIARGTAHLMKYYTEGMRRSVVDHIERWLTHHPDPRASKNYDAINQEEDRTRERHRIRQELEEVDGDLERLREQVHAESHFEAGIHVSKGNFYREDGFSLPDTSVVVEITPSHEVEALEVFLDTRPLFGVPDDADRVEDLCVKVSVPQEVLADAQAEDGEARIVLVCSDPAEAMSDQDLDFFTAQDDVAYVPVAVPGIHHHLPTGPQLRDDHVRVAVSLYGLDASGERAQEIDALLQRRQELLARQHVLVSPHLFCPGEMTTDIAETMEESRMDLRAFKDKVKDLRAHEPEADPAVAR